MPSMAFRPVQSVPLPFCPLLRSAVPSCPCIALLCIPMHCGPFQPLPSCTFHFGAFRSNALRSYAAGAAPYNAALCLAVLRDPATAFRCPALLCLPCQCGPRQSCRRSPMLNSSLPRSALLPLRPDPLLRTAVHSATSRCAPANALRAHPIQRFAVPCGRWAVEAARCVAFPSSPVRSCQSSAVRCVACLAGAAHYDPVLPSQSVAPRCIPLHADAVHCYATLPMPSSACRSTPVRSVAALPVRYTSVLRYAFLPIRPGASLRAPMQRPDADALQSVPLRTAPILCLPSPFCHPIPVPSGAVHCGALLPVRSFALRSIPLLRPAVLPFRCAAFLADPLQCPAVPYCRRSPMRR